MREQLGHYATLRQGGLMKKHCLSGPPCDRVLSICAFVAVCVAFTMALICVDPAGIVHAASCGAC